MPVAVLIERGAKRTFAYALDWPGWARVARDEQGALEALVAYAPRYARVLTRKRIAAPKVANVRDLRVSERVAGSATTDFGAPAGESRGDDRPVSAADHRKLRALLEACWAEFDALAAAAKGRSLATGPRGGGRDLTKMTAHAIEADAGYISALGGRYRGEGVKASDRLARVREGFVAALAARARGEVPDRGPRGGVRWQPRFAVRRSAWHWLDHAWEIEDRLET